MVGQKEHFKHAGKDSFKLRVKSLTHYKNKEPRHRLLNLFNILSISKLAIIPLKPSENL